MISMFRISRSFRATSLPTTLFTASRRASSRLVGNEEAYRVQPVRFVQRVISKQQLATWILYTGCVCGYLYYIFPEVHIEEVVEEAGQNAKEGTPQDQGDEWADEDSKFIPLTWAKKMPREFYKGSDPEWQEFRKVASDKERQKKAHST